MKVGIVGGGAMGEAIVAALTRGGVTQAAGITVADVARQRLAHLDKTYGVGTTSANPEAAAGADYLIMAVKPQDFEKAAADMKAALPGGGVVVSIMAGVTLAQLGRLFSHNAIVRAMPNTPAQIGEGMTVWTATAAVTPAGREGAQQIFAALGREAYVPEERYLDMATGLSGSGPAYVFLFIEALIDAGVLVGLSRDLATTMALQTVAGAAHYAIESGRPVAELRGMVTSPAGTTAAGLRALEAGGLRAAVTEAVVAAYDRSRALGEASK